LNAKTEGAFAILAAFIVLFSAMWDPRISVGLSVVALVGFGIYRFATKNR
jgi:hypothetical protein